jgi:hypothetical protein
MGTLLRLLFAGLLLWWLRPLWRSVSGRSTASRSDPSPKDFQDLTPFEIEDGDYEELR